MMREQGGDIRLEERPGGGDRFVITLPAVRTTTKPAGDATKHPGEFGANASRPQLAWQPRIEAT